MNTEPKSYQATVEVDGEDRPVRLSFSTAEAGSAVIDLIPTERHGVFNARVGDVFVPVMIHSDGISSVNVDLRGYRYTVKVLSSHHHRLLSILRASPAMQSRVAKITSPMPGLIKSVFVEENAEVAKGDTIFTLEAMKMENAITAPAAGRVKNLSVSEGRAVEKGALLCLIEPIA